MEGTLMRKLKILADSAKYDVSCSSSGSSRQASGRMGNGHMAGICHTWAADGRCVSLLKVLFTNRCEYNCAYCVNRRDNDFPRASFEPEELAALTIEFYRRNYIEGLFLSSAVEISPDYTAERILRCLTILREDYGFAGYIHAKIIPGVSPEILHRIGLVADRLSVNIELPSEGSLRKFAPQKQARQIFAPMRQITNTLIETRSLKGPGNMFRGQELNSAEHYLTGKIGEGGQGLQKPRAREPEHGLESVRGPREQEKESQWSKPGARVAEHGLKPVLGVQAPAEGSRRLAWGSASREPGAWDMADHVRLPVPGKREFAAAGQTTQMIIGAGQETDQSILTTSEQLYRTFKMKRVYYSAYVPVVSSPILPDRGTAPPLRREHRIYQADWLLRFYGFTARELFSGSEVNLDPDLDPKVTWALRNLEQFPVEVNRASFDMLLRVPGIGAVSAKRIMRQRRFAAVRYEDLKKMGVVLKRAKYFLTCCGRYWGDRRFEPETIRNQILQMEDGLQLSMFDGDWKPVEEGERKEKLSAAGVI